MEKISLPYGAIRKVARLVGRSEAWMSKVFSGQVQPSYDLAFAIDRTGIVPVSMVDRYNATKFRDHVTTPAA